MTPKFLLRFGLLTALGLAAFVLASGVRADDPPKPDPGMAEPGMADPGMAEPGMAEPAMDDPGMADPGMAEPVPAPAAAPVAKCDILEATAELDRLKGYLKNKKADNGDITASMDAVMKCYRGFLPADDAAKAGMTDVEKKYLDQVEGELMDALLLKKVRPNSETNDRDDVNVKAAQLLGQTRPAISKKIIDALEKDIFKAKEYKPAAALIDEAFKALGTLNDHKVALPYIIKEYTAKFDNTAGRPERIKAAWDCLLLFKNVPAKDRLEVVKNAVKTYTGPEHAAEVNKTPDDRAAKEVWDKIKGSVIKAVQSFAKDPKDEKGNVIATMKGFENWLRDNDKYGKEPWRDDVKPNAAPPGPAPAK